MAIGKKTGGKNFKPGNKANPNGRPKVPSDVKEARRLNTNLLTLTFNRLIFMTEAELRLHWENPNTPKFEKIVCKILNQAEVRGDHYRLDFILNRLVGKVTEKVEHSLPRPTIVKRSDGSEMVLGAKRDREEGDTE
jgi:hypothetical protein